MKNKNHFKEINGCEFHINDMENSLILGVPITLPYVILRTSAAEFFYFNKDNVRELRNYLEVICEVMNE